MTKNNSKTLWNIELNEWSELPSVKDISSESFDGMVSEYLDRDLSDLVKEKTKAFKTKANEEILRYIVR